MISKETFCKALSLIKEQDETNQKFSDALQLVGDGHFVFGADNQYLNALLLVMKEAVDDKYDYIEWWLYDATEDHRVWSEDESKEWNLTDPAALYDFIKDECRLEARRTWPRRSPCDGLLTSLPHVDDFEASGCDRGKCGRQKAK